MAEKGIVVLTMDLKTPVTGQAADVSARASIAAEVYTTTKEHINDVFPLYEVMFAKFNQEGDGYWSRFNVLITLNVALFTAAGYLSINTSGVIGWHHLAVLGLDCVGLLLSLWSFYVLRRLSQWHEHWRDVLESLELMFPEKYRKPMTTRPDTLKSDAAWFRRIGYAEPIMFGMGVCWFAFLLLSQ